MWCVAGRLRDALSIVGRVLLLALLVGLSSCVQPTVFPRYLTVADVINNVKCELYMALWQAVRENPKEPWLDDWTALFSIVLQVKRQTGVNGDFTFVVPYNAPVGLFTVVVGGKADKTGQSRMTFVFKADDNLGIFRSSEQCDYPHQLNSRNNLAGETGLRLWFGNVIDGINQADISKKSITSLIYNLQFVTTLNGHIKPSFQSAYPSKKVFSGAFGIDRTRTDDNQLTITFTAPVAAASVSADTGLVKVLAQVLKALEDLRKALKVAERERSKAQTGLEERKMWLKKQSPGILPGAIAEDPKVIELRKKKTAADKQVKVFEKTIESVDKAISSIGAAGAAAAPSGQAATQARLNQLLLLDAIRDIPR